MIFTVAFLLTCSRCRCPPALAQTPASIRMRSVRKRKNADREDAKTPVASKPRRKRKGKGKGKVRPKARGKKVTVPLQTKCDVVRLALEVCQDPGTKSVEQLCAQKFPSVLLNDKGVLKSGLVRKWCQRAREKAWLDINWELVPHKERVLWKETPALVKDAIQNGTAKGGNRRFFPQAHKL